MSSQRPRPLAPVVASSASGQKMAVVEPEFSAGPGGRNGWQQTNHYHLFPAAHRYPIVVYSPSRSNSTPTELPVAYYRPAPEPTNHQSEIPCGTVSTRGLRIRGAPGRMTHIKGTACVVMAIAVVFIVVLVLALVSHRQDS